MKNGITEVVMIVDKSGSMHGLESDTIGGFNSMIDEQRKKEGQVYVTTVFFNDGYDVIHDRAPLDKVKDITAKDYITTGSTALIDAIGRSIDHISDIHKYIREEDVPENTIFVIITDGMENASRKYSSSQVKKMISQKKEDKNWEFIFLGANIDACETAESFGIERDRAVDYLSDSVGTKKNFNVLGRAIMGMRSTGKFDTAELNEIREDYKSRKKK